MSVVRPDYLRSLGRNMLGAFLALALVIAGLLSASPAWHEFFHPASAPHHVCVVTIFAAGQCEGSVTALICVAPDPLPQLATLSGLDGAILARDHFFSLLEHAPPAFA